MNVICTYCSANKVLTNQLLPAIELYKSERINLIYQKAFENNIPFLILSGKYGLVDSNDEIEYYDYLLKPKEVENHAQLVASQLQIRNITEVQFYSTQINEDPNVISYIDTMIKACSIVKIPFKIKFDNYKD